MSQFPIMPTFVPNIMVDTSHLEPEVLGVYIRLLWTMWMGDGTVPDDDHFLARAGGVGIRKWRALRSEVMTFLTPIGDDRLTQKKLMKTRRELVEKSLKNKDAANIRWARQRAYPSKSGHSAHANAYANGDANAYPTRARNHIQIKEPSTSQSLPDDGMPTADAAEAGATGPPAFPVSDALLNTKILKKAKGH